MPDTVTATAGATVNAPVTDRYREGAELGPSAPTNELGKDEFLKLLVAQLKHQDPLNPTSSDEFISTSAQFTVVEKLDELTKQAASSALVTSLATASSLLGREITAVTNHGPITATVERSEISSGQVVLVTDQGAVRLDQVASVGPVTSTEPDLPPSRSSTPDATPTGDQQ